ncbi:MAG TPA: bifunctional diaminohydroxyphosphoribosylaminopyrimidine deaminase/5-amino-6-(5-phosphoribosylamino)uracil reductase RibD [Thermodesulfovibrionales bacterium]|nr:bifunctional diaminohydroxyphosphoribosylaminopyrimidine deaminase/5-amino-6-(5-phosphoribosylamino)uracil reductase RibD [Thermodesulfovibrionales bacterium]
MSRVIALAARARGTTSPNPMVGAVLVKNGRILAEAYHKRPGTPHAEALAIAQAGKKACSSSLYVSLEPCCHTDKRTPPCTKEIIRAGIRKVVVAMQDPNPKVSGKGLKELEQAGIKVVSGLLEEKARRLNECYIKYISTKRPFVILKVAMTLDGKIATKHGLSRWITGEKSRRMVHRLRSSVDAVMTAIGTVKADNPQLTSRIGGGRNPKRIIIDPNLETPLDAKVLSSPPETIIVTREIGQAKNSPVRSRLTSLVNSGISTILFKDVLDLNWLMVRLGEMGITSLMVEGGASLSSHALEDGVVDKVMFFIAPKILGGKDSIPAVGGIGLQTLKDAYTLKGMTVRRTGEDLLVEGYL